MSIEEGVDDSMKCLNYGHEECHNFKTDKNGEFIPACNSFGILNNPGGKCPYYHPEIKAWIGEYNSEA